MSDGNASRSRGPRGLADLVAEWLPEAVAAYRSRLGLPSDTTILVSGAEWLIDAVEQLGLDGIQAGERTDGSQESAVYLYQPNTFHMEGGTLDLEAQLGWRGWLIHRLRWRNRARLRGQWL